MSQLNINVAEMERQSSRISTINEEFRDASNKLYTNASNFYGNLEGSGKNSLNISSFNSSIKKQTELIVSDFEKVKSFIDTQMESYRRDATTTANIVTNLVSTLKSCILDIS